MSCCVALAFASFVAAAPTPAGKPVVRPDPPAVRPDWPAAVPVVEVPDGGYDLTIPADRGGPFVALGQTTAAGLSVAVVDLRTGKPVGRWKAGLRKTSGHALSPDGKVLAMAVEQPPAVKGQWPPQADIVALDTATGRRLWKTRLGRDPGQLHFDGSDWLFTSKGSTPGDRPEMFDAWTGRVIRRYDRLPPSCFALAVSPGGRYLAGAEGTSVTVVAAADGAFVHRFTPSPELVGVRTASEVRFSPDGARVAAVYTEWPDRKSVRVLAWHLATGRQYAEFTQPYDWNWVWVTGPDLRWTADGSAWFLHGLGLVDPDTGAVLWRVTPGEEGFRKCLPLAAHRVIRIEAGREKSRARVRDVVLPAAKVAAARTAAETGDPAIDGWLPPATVADRVGARAVAVPARADDWTYTPDPVPPGGPTTSVWLPFSPEWVESVHVTLSAAVVELVEKPEDGIAPLTPRRAVRVDPTTGKRTGRIELPHVVRLADVSPDAGVAATIDRDDERRVDVWDLNTGKHVAGWRPGGSREPGGKLAHVSALSADRVLTLTRGGELAVWSVPKVQAVFVAEYPGLGVPVRSPGRKYLFALHGDRVRVIEAATGRLAGDLPTGLTGPVLHGTGLVPDTRVPVPRPALAARPDGAEFAGVFRVGTTSHVVRWDLRTAKLLGTFEMPVKWNPWSYNIESVRYAGPDHLLVRGEKLVGLKSGEMEWDYESATYPWPRFAATAPDGRVWYTVGERVEPAAAVVSGAVGARQRAGLVAAELPGPFVTAALRAGADKNAEDLIAPGRTVGVRVELTDPPDDKVHDAIVRAVRSKLETFKLKPTDGEADVVFTFSAWTTRGRERPIPIRLAGERVTEADASRVQGRWVQVDVEATLTVDGKRAWLAPLTGISPFGLLYPEPVVVPDKKIDLTKWLTDEIWNGAADGVGNVTLPMRVIRTPAGPTALPGASQLFADGPGPLRNRVMANYDPPRRGQR